MSNREELISKVALAPYGVGIRGVEPGRGKMSREEKRSGGGRSREEKLFWGEDMPYCSGAEGADERRGGRGRRVGMRNRERRKRRGGDCGGRMNYKEVLEK